MAVSQKLHGDNWTLLLPYFSKIKREGLSGWQAIKGAHQSICQEVSTVCSEDTGTRYDDTNDDEETEYDSEDNPDIRVIPGQMFLDLTHYNYQPEL